MKESIQGRSKWLITGFVALSALAIGARDATASPQVNAWIDNPNPGSSACAQRNGHPYSARTYGYRASDPSTVFCQVESPTTTTLSDGCGSTSHVNRVDVWMMVYQTGTSVSIIQNNPWGVDVKATFKQPGCLDIVAHGSGTG